MGSALNILGYISTSAVVVPLIIACLNFKYISDYTKPLFFYFIASFVTEITCIILDKYYITITPILFIYTILEFILISLFYYRFLNRYIKSSIINIISILFILVSILCIYIFGLQKADLYARTLESFALPSYCLFLFYYVLKNLVFDNLLDSPIFWINTAILLYFAGNLVIFIFSEYIANHRSESYLLLWKSIHTFFNVSMNILFGIGFWKLRTK